METTSNKKNKSFISAKGVAEPYCYLKVPDYGSGQFKNDRGLYKVSLTVDSNDPKCKQMIDQIVAVHEEDYAERLEDFKANPPKVAKGKKPLQPYIGDMPFTENEDGTTTFNFKCYASFVDKKTQEVKQINVPIVDSQGKVINGKRPAIRGGSELKIMYNIIPYGWSQVAGASVKLQLSSVMLIKLVEFSGDVTGAWADEAVDGGFTATESEWDEPQNNNDSDNTPSDSDDF